MRGAVRILALLFFVAIQFGCQQAAKKIPSESAPSGRPQEGIAEGQVLVVPPPPVATPPPQVGGVIPPIATLPEIHLPKSQAPRVGIILGPGGMKAWAHIGVLREIQNARIPIASIVGMEWGAYIGALYAMKGQVNDAEWQSMKIKDGDIPGAGLFGAKLDRKNISILDGGFNSSFGPSLLQSFKIEFACPTVKLNGERVLFQTKGSSRAVMSRCVPFPPFFADSGGYLAGVFAFEESVEWLRARGAQVIIFVDVLGAGDLFLPKMVQNNFVEGLIWYEVRRAFRKPNQPLFHHVISVDTQSNVLTDAGGRRSLILKGQADAAESVRQLARKYGI